MGSNEGLLAAINVGAGTNNDYKINQPTILKAGISDWQQQQRLLATVDAGADINNHSGSDLTVVVAWSINIKLLTECEENYSWIELSETIYGSFGCSST